ncbi:hypothetical protein VN24_11250 [Paenibacillus beijingensis]|uniref:Uncharacterized protein n=1 Tax=Paenibacillus beijingensis TaxID=1126833 RepID=A0A0D5NID3_9BACL|nr:hypothetical protein VN24_11250 [Paenibacillus beijingensis]
MKADRMRSAFLHIVLWLIYADTMILNNRSEFPKVIFMINHIYRKILGFLCIHLKVQAIVT